MHDDEYVRRIREYIELHKARFYPEAIRKRLIAEGHDPVVVDRLLAEAFARALPYGAPQTPPKRLSMWDLLLFVLRIGVVMGGVLLFNALLVGTCFAMITGGSVIPIVLLATAAAVFVGTLVYARWRRIPILLAAALLVAPGFALALLVGACLALFIVSY